jgi:hypothetical protein
MMMQRAIRLSAMILGLGGLAMVLPGCGGGGPGEVSSTGEVKIIPPTNASKENPGVQDEYKNLDPAGKAK